MVLGFKTIRNNPKEILILNDKINSTSLENTLEKRTEILKQIDNFAKKSNIYSLIKVRLDQALKEIPITQVPEGKVKIWYIYNMGVIAKSSEKTIAFDLAGDYVYPNMAKFAKYIDILVVSHFDGDHFSLSVVKEALKNGVTIITPNNKINGINSNNLISLQPQEKTVIKGVEITAYPAKHIHNPDEEDSFTNPPTNWYYVNLSGIALLHTGDSVDFDYQPDFTNKNVDVYMIHSTTLDPRTNEGLMKLVPNAKTILPLHVLELGHGSDIFNPKHNWYMTYQSILDNYSNGYYKPLQGEARFIPMIWGESLFF